MGAHITFGKASYQPGETIGFTVTVDEPMSKTVTVTGEVVTPGGDHLPATCDTTVYGTYGPFTAEGYVVTPDPADPAHFLATPA